MIWLNDIIVQYSATVVHWLWACVLPCSLSISPKSNFWFRGESSVGVSNVLHEASNHKLLLPAQGCGTNQYCERGDEIQSSGSEIFYWLQHQSDVGCCLASRASGTSHWPVFQTFSDYYSMGSHLLPMSVWLYTGLWEWSCHLLDGKKHSGKATICSNVVFSTHNFPGFPWYGGIAYAAVGHFIRKIKSWIVLFMIK